MKEYSIDNIVRDFAEDMGLEPEDVQELYIIFIEELMSELESFKAYLKKNDIEGALRTIHNIKGISANYKVQTVFTLSKQLHEILRSGDLSKLDYNLDMLEKSCQQLQQEIKTYIKK